MTIFFSSPISNTPFICIVVSCFLDSTELLPFLETQNLLYYKRLSTNTLPQKLAASSMVNAAVLPVRQASSTGPTCSG